MPRRPLGATGVSLPVVGLGGITVSGRRRGGGPEHGGPGLRAGASTTSTWPPTYGDAELLLGAALESYRARCFLAGKTNRRTAAEAGPELASSLRRLRTDRLDLYQLHALRSREDVETAFGAGGAIETLRQAPRGRGTVRFLGFSAHSVEAALAAIDRFAFDTVMFPVNPRPVVRRLRPPGRGPGRGSGYRRAGPQEHGPGPLARGRPSAPGRPGTSPMPTRARCASRPPSPSPGGPPPCCRRGDPELFWSAVEACTAPAGTKPAAGDEEGPRPRGGRRRSPVPLPGLVLKPPG